MLRPACLSLSLFFALSALSLAQESPFDARRDEPVALEAQAPVPTMPQSTEMWLYERERERYEDPKTAIRRKAELKSVQRAERLAALQWYGMSNSRPTYNLTPFFGGYQSGFWGSNTYDPSRWRPITPYVVVQPGSGRY